MKRFRFTLLAVCLFLIGLGSYNCYLFFRNMEPAEVSIETLERQPPPREYLHVTGGTLDLERAVSTSGAIELDALLVPLRSDSSGEKIEVMVETRDPRLLDLFRTYHFQFDSVLQKNEYLREHRDEFHPRRDVTGSLMGIVARGNRDKMLKLAQSAGLDVSDQVVFLTEGKEPPRYSGFFFVAVGLLGMVKALSRWKAGKPEPAGEDDLTIPPAA